MRFFLTMGDDGMFFRAESNIKSNIKYKANIEDVKFDDIVIKATPVNYFIIYDFYLFLIDELESLEKILTEKYPIKDIEHLLLRIDTFLENFNFDLFFIENFEELMMRLNESSLSKLNEIIGILKEEYNIFKKMDPELEVYSDMIDWIEDALYLLKGFAEKLATNQKEMIAKLEFYDLDECKDRKSPLSEGSYAA
jgi:hypothetical protein